MKVSGRVKTAASLCPNQCANAVGNSLCRDHCAGADDTTCHDHCYGGQDVGCHDHCYGVGDTACHDHCYAPGDVNCHDHCYGLGSVKPPKTTKPPKAPKPASPCHNNCSSTVDNSQCHDHCYGAGDTQCHNWCFGAQDLQCHDHCYGANDSQCHDHCYGAGAVNCHNSCTAPKPKPKPKPTPQPRIPTPPGGPSGRLPTGKPTVVNGTIPSDAITGAFSQPPNPTPGPGGAGVGVSGRGGGARGGSGGGGGGTRAGSPSITPLAPGTAAVGAQGQTGGAGRTAGAAAGARTQGSAGRTTGRTTGGGTRNLRHPTSQPVIPVGIPTFPAIIDRYIGQVPWWVWLALVIAFSAAATAGVAALRSGRRARARAGEVAMVTADAMTDPLTGILNRRGFTTVAQRELERAQRYGHPLALAFVDVRGLKGVNDSRGHQAGDELLKEVASLLKQSSRSHDVVGRIGGDELAVMLTEQGADGMAAVMRRVRAQLPSSRAALGFDHDWDLTIGMAVYPRDGHSVEALLAAADRRLYLQRGIEIQ